MNMSKRLTTQEFIERSKKIFPNLDYTLVNYVNNHTNVKIICSKHGIFDINPNNHLRGHGCPKCGHILGGKKNSKNLEYYINIFKKIHGDKYDYSKVEYIDAKTKVKIICPEHGEFWQTPYEHSKGHGCQKCGIKKTINTTKLSNEKAQEIIKEQSIKNHYKYRPFNYINAQQHIKCTCIVCNNEWEQTYNHLSRGRGCRKCAVKKTTDSYRLETDEVLRRIRPYAERNLYEIISVDNYVNNTTNNILCKCKKCNREFSLSLSNAQHDNACPYHNNSKLENYIRHSLTKNNIRFEEQKKFKWLGRQRLDFYLPEYNIAIECQGKQHFYETTNWKKFNFEHICELDKLKYKLCKENNIKILYFTFEENEPPINYIDKIYTKVEKIILMLFNKKYLVNSK